MTHDHPVIRHLERTGYPDGKEPKYPRCPVCGSECDTVYMSAQLLSAVGCDVCVFEQDAGFSESCYE